MTVRGGGAPLRRVEAIADIAAHTQAFGEPAVSWRQAAAPSRMPGPTPAFIFGPVSAGVGRALFGRIDLPAAGCFAVQDAAAGPSGVIVKDGVALFGDPLDVSQAQATAVAHQLNARATTTLQVQGTLVSLVGGGPGAVLTRVMPLLWVLAAAGYDLAGLQYLVPWDAPAELLPLLSAFGLQEAQLVRCREAGDVVRAPRILAPASLRVGDRFLPAMGDATRFWSSRLEASLGLTPPETGSATFLSPGDGWEGMDVANGQAIEDHAADAGMSVLRPAKLEIGERVRHYAAAPFLMGLDGPDLLEACVFAPPGAAVCAIRGSGARSFALLGLAHALGHRLGYLFATPNREDFEAAGDVDSGVVRRGMKALSLMA